MKVRYKLGRGKGRAVFDICDDGPMTLEDALELVKNPNVIQITITKMTVKEYLKKVGPVNGGEHHGD